MIKSNVLSAVLGFECTPYIEDDGSFWVLTQYGWNKGEPSLENAKQYPKGLNLHELANKCKVWAYENGYVISTEVSCKDKFNVTTKSLHRSIVNLNSDQYEYEAIFKACEFVFNIIKDQQ